MCRELVRLTTEDVSKAIPVTTSRKIAEEFNKKHYIVLRDIRELELNLKESLSKSDLGEYKIVCTEYVDVQGKSQNEYLMNFDFYMMLVMGYNTKKAFEVKNRFIKAFKFMKNELQARQEVRHIGVMARKSLTDTIKNKVDDGTNFKKFAYGNYSKLVYKKVLGKTVKKIKEERNLKKSDNLRDFLSIEELEQVQELESKIAFYIEMRKDLTDNDKEIYQEVKKYVDSITR